MWPFDVRAETTAVSPVGGDRTRCGATSSRARAVARQVTRYGLILGLLFAVVFAVTYGRVGNVSARLLSLYVAGGMLLSLYVVPSLKYPAKSFKSDETDSAAPSMRPTRWPAATPWRSSPSTAWVRSSARVAGGGTSCACGCVELTTCV